MGPIVIKAMMMTPEFNPELGIKKAFEQFRLQFGTKTVTLECLKKFIKMLYNYLISKLLRVDKNQLTN